MKEARSAIIVVLILLFIIVGIGVAISRISDKEKAEGIVKTDDQRGFLERIFLGNDTKDSEEDADTTSADSKESPSSDDGKMVIINESDNADAGTASQGSKGSTTFTLGSKTTTVSPASETKGGVTPVMTQEEPSTIPSTGSPTAVVISSLMGLAGGVYLRFGGRSSRAN